MGFWETALGTAPAPQAAPVYAPPAPVQAPQPVQQGPWWQQQQYVQPQAPLAPQQLPPEPQEPGQWGTVEGSTRRAQSASLDGRCPECGSGNYFRPKGHPNAMMQCFECGSNGRFDQLAAGAGLPGGDAAGPATPARQVAHGGLNGVSNYNPQQVIGRVAG